MEEGTHGWHHLRDHATPPPREVFDNLRQLLDPSVGETDSAFRRLGSHSIPPPAQLRSAIMDSVTPDLNRRPQRWLPYAAAACVLLFAIGFIRYKSAHGNKPSVANNSAHMPPGVTPANTPSRTLQATPSTTAPPGDSAGTAPIRLSPAALTLDGDQLALADNNPLLTFTSYRYPSLGKYINSGNSPTALHIRLDQYTSITLSSAMTATLRELYDTRPDGTPSRKARKTRERLEKWNGEDAKEFDPHNTANPLDAVDLAEFLFPPLFSFDHHSGVVLPAAATPATAPAAGALDSSSIDNNPLTISYSLTLVTKKANTGIGETYNGGIQTLFTQNGYSRLRLASLMRIQSEIMPPDAHSVTILAESVKPQRETTLTPGQWVAYNGKYAGMTRSMVDDSLVILGYRCKKALISLHDGRHITAWYTPDIRQPAQARIEPVFAGIPGLVLRYDYTCRHKTIRYTATGLSRRPVDPSVFTIP